MGIKVTHEPFDHAPHFRIRRTRGFLYEEESWFRKPPFSFTQKEDHTHEGGEQQEVQEAGDATRATRPGGHERASNTKQGRYVVTSAL